MDLSDRDQPLPVGWTKAGDSIAEPVDAQKARFSQAATLGDIGKWYEFYTPALLYLSVRLGDRDPTADFIQEHGDQVKPISLVFERPVFKGLTLLHDESWNYGLFAMERGAFQAFKQWLGTLSFLDRDLGRVQRMRFQELNIVDPLYLSKRVVLSDEPPRVRVTAFCIDGSDQAVWLQPAKWPPGLPFVRRSKEVSNETRAFARAVLAGATNPYAAAAMAREPDQAEAMERELRERLQRFVETGSTDLRGSENGPN